MLNSTVKTTETVCRAFYHILRPIKTRFTQGRLCYTQGPFFYALGPLFCALVREEAIFAVCKRCANEGFACMCKENDLLKKMYGLVCLFYTCPCVCVDTMCYMFILVYRPIFPRKIKSSRKDSFFNRRNETKCFSCLEIDLQNLKYL